MPKSQTRKPIEIKISTVVAISTILHETDPAILDAALQQLTGGVSDFFDDEFAVIDVGALDLPNTRIDWAALIALLKSYHLNPVAVRNAAPEMSAAIVAHGLSLDVVAKARDDMVAPPAKASPAPATQPAAANPAPGTPLTTMIIDTPVRAGQRIYARGADLIVTAAVNNGAEIIADGSIHVYAPLRGRALAGASGNAAARIFSFGMEPELVSIAGMYRTFENGFPAELAGKPAQVRLIGDRIEVALVNPAGR
ncbi:septum site-determining protein MinC [Undibacterium arcticum]|uniref:Probable septum site-determining protein MinC n=1 Tax=Undibacterium arcticum TaxID=1762892 RepID=A0ABV7F924_9BURK